MNTPKRILTAVNALLLGTMVVLVSTGAALNPRVQSVETLTNGVLWKHTNFFGANRTSIVTSIQGLIQTGQVQLSFSSDFIVSQGTNVALTASNLYASITALNLASNVSITNLTAATNTLYNGVLTQISSASNALYSTTTNYVWASTNKIYTNLVAQISSATNSAYTNTQAGISNALVTMTNILTAYNSNILGGFTLSGILLGSGPLTNVAHGLGATPRFLVCVLVCRTNDLGYVIGDTIAVDAIEGSSDERSLLIGGNSTNVFLIQRNSVAVKTMNKADGINGTLDIPSWTATIYAGQ